MIEAGRGLRGRRFAILLLGVMLLAATGCGDESASSNVEPEGELEMKLLARDKFCRRDEPALLAVRTVDEWARVWADAMSETTVGHEPARVDFTRDMVLAAFLGAGPEGRDVAIHRVAIEGDEVVVTWFKREGKGAGGGGSSSPYCLVRVRKSPYDVVWREAESR